MYECTRTTDREYVEETQKYRRFKCGQKFATFQQLTDHRRECGGIPPMGMGQEQRLKDLQRMTDDFNLPEGVDSIHDLSGEQAVELISKLESILIQRDREAAQA